MTAEYRFFGSQIILRGAELSKYGQVVEMEPEEADKLIAETPPALILPENLWAECGITAAELAEFPSVSIHGAAPEAFRVKTVAVRTAFHDYRKGLLKAAAAESTPGSAPAPAARSGAHQAPAAAPITEPPSSNAPVVEAPVPEPAAAEAQSDGAVKA
ncbi:MAG TPA: hypothetical protein VHY84_27380 [Bryobacteraceae bacterium]|jgi:hypothetical protein|nr:hypothetical protein [Bryobacteraceae bacterium]